MCAFNSQALLETNAFILQAADLQHTRIASVILQPPPAGNSCNLLGFGLSQPAAGCPQSAMLVASGIPSELEASNPFFLQLLQESRTDG